MPCLNHGIQKTTKNTNISVFNWILRSSRGMIEVKVSRTQPCSFSN
ncbi:hypothetical protein [Candidatus Rickettsia kedanie]